MTRSFRTLCTAICSLALAIAGSAVPASDTTISRAVARVGDDVITSVELDRVLAPVRRQLEGRFSPDELEIQVARARRAALRQMIDRKLIAIEAKGMEINLPAVEIDKQIDKIRADYATEEDFQSFLDESRITREELRKMVDEDLQVKVLFQEKVARRVRVSPSEIHDYYQLHVSEYLQPAQVHMYEILIKKEPDHVKGLQKAKDVRSELKAGANFQQVARLRSEGPKREQGGDWGTLSEGDFGDEMAEVEKAAFRLSPGQLSDIVETKHGYHIIYIDRKKASHILTEEEAYDEVYTRLFQEKLALVYDDFIQHLRDKIYVELLDESMDDLPSATTVPVAPELPGAGSAKK